MPGKVEEFWHDLMASDTSPAPAAVARSAQRGSARPQCWTNLIKSSSLECKIQFTINQCLQYQSYLFKTKKWHSMAISLAALLATVAPPVHGHALQPVRVISKACSQSHQSHQSSPVWRILRWKSSRSQVEYCLMSAFQARWTSST